MSGNSDPGLDVTQSMSVLPPDPADTFQPDALEQQLRGLARAEPEWSVARTAAQDITWARLLAPPLPAASVARDLARQIAQEAQPERAAERLPAQPPATRPVPGWRGIGRYGAPAGALGVVLLPALLPGVGTVAGQMWAALGLNSPLLWSGAVWAGLLLAVILALVLSTQAARWQMTAPRWAGGVLLALCLLPLLLTEPPASPGATTQVLGLLGREQTGSASSLPWPLLLGLVALLMLIRWPNAARPPRFTLALARGVLGLGLAVVGTLALLRLNLKGLGLGGLLVTALSLLAGLSVALKTLGQQLLVRLHWPASRLMEAAFGLGGFALLSLEPRVAAPAALMGGVWGLGQLLSPAGAARPAAA